MLKNLIKFKHCYDYNYTPDWNNGDEYKWSVYFSAAEGEYVVDWTVSWTRPSTVYFSSEEIAQKCADWLNKGCPDI